MRQMNFFKSASSVFTSLQPLIISCLFQKTINNGEKNGDLVCSRITFSKMTYSRMAFGIMAFRRMAFRRKTFRKTTFRRMTFRSGE